MCQTEHAVLGGTSFVEVTIRDTPEDAFVVHVDHAGADPQVCDPLEGEYAEVHAALAASGIAAGELFAALPIEFRLEPLSSPLSEQDARSVLLRIAEVVGSGETIEFTATTGDDFFTYAGDTGDIPR